MKIFINLLLILGTLFFLASITIFSTLSFSHSHQMQQDQIKDYVIPLKNNLFEKSLLQSTSLKAPSFEAADEALSAQVIGYLGYQYIENKFVSYQSPKLDNSDLLTTKWGKSELTNEGVITHKKHLKKISYVNILSNSEFIIYYNTFHETIIVESLQFFTLSLIAYLLFLLLVVLIIFIFSKKNANETQPPQEESQSQSDSDSESESTSESENLAPEETPYNTLLSLHTFNKADIDCFYAVESNTPFTFAHLQFNSNNDTAIDEIYLLNTLNQIIGNIDNYFDFTQNNLFLFLKSTPLKTALNLIQDFNQEISKESPDIALKAGLSALNERDIQANDLIKEAQIALNKADAESPIIGFNADRLLYEQIHERIII